MRLCISAFVLGTPDADRLVLEIRDPGPAAPAPDAEGREKTPPPIVIRRLQFKSDGEGYLGDRRTHLHLLEVARGQMAQLTSGPWGGS